jgi:hypothetical protein
MNQSVLPYCVIYDMDQSILKLYFLKKSIAMGITTVAMGITTVATRVDNSYAAMGIDDIIMSIATILLF